MDGRRARPSTRAGVISDPGENVWHGVSDGGFFNNHPVYSDNVLSITGHEGGPRAGPMTDEELKEKLWQLFHRQQILWDTPYDYEIRANIALAFNEAGGQVRNLAQQAPRGNKTALAEQLLADIGIGAFPGLRTGTAVMKLVAEAASLILDVKDKSDVGAFQDIESQHSAFEKIGKDAVMMELSRSITKHGILVGTYVYDVGTSVVDFTGLSHLPSAAVRAVRTAWDLRRHRKMVIAANEALSDKSKFSPEIFKKVPLLGCALMHKLSPGDLMGIFDALHLPELNGKTREFIISTLSEQDQKAVANYTEKVISVKAIAKKTVETAPYCLPSELERRKRRGMKGRVVDNLPSFLRSGNDELHSDVDGVDSI